MFGFDLNPYILYIKIAVVAAVLAFTFWAGHRWAHLACEADKTEAITRAHVLLEESLKQYRERIAQLEGINSVVVAENATTKAKMRTDRSKFDKERANVLQKTGDIKLSVGFWRLWNGSIERVNGSVPSGTPSAAGTPEANNAITDSGLSSALGNHDEIVQLCGGWKADLESIRAWDAKTFPAR